MKKLLFILLYFTCINAFGQVSVNFEQNITNPDAYFIVKITNQSNKSILIKNKDNLSNNGSNISFIILDKSNVKLGEMEFVFSAKKHFEIKSGETKIIQYSRNAVMGYRTSSNPICTFKVLLHLDYILPYEYPVVGGIQYKNFDSSRTFNFY